MTGRTNLRLAFLVFTVAVTAVSGSAKVIYVDDDAAGANNGTSWANAYNYLQDALAYANSSEKPIEIRVAHGVYKPDQGKDITPGNYSATFRLINGVTLKGGYASSGALDPNQRDIVLYKTTLSGDLGGDDLPVNDPCDLVYAVKGYNSYTVVTGSGTDSTAVLEGFTITGGHWAAESNPPSGHGAGMHNSAGSPALINCTFTGNICSYGGRAGIYNIDGSNPILVNCTFEKNYGGGMGNTVSNPIMTDCTFRDNFGLNRGSAIFNGGSSPVLTRCIFSDNRVGAIYNYQSSPMLTDCTFIHNSASRGCAMFNTESNVTLVGCTFRENGGAISSGGGDLPPFYVPTIIRELSTLCVLFGEGEGPAEAGAEAKQDAAKAAGVM